MRSAIEKNKKACYYLDIFDLSSRS